MTPITIYGRKALFLTLGGYSVSDEIRHDPVC
jgi:hypothetical protein